MPAKNILRTQSIVGTFNATPNHDEIAYNQEEEGIVNNVPIALRIGAYEAR
ncbi:MAG: hypothetical protein ACJ0Q9_05845 [Gammaproteobacteria bacterium]